MNKRFIPIQANLWLLRASSYAIRALVHCQKIFFFLTLRHNPSYQQVTHHRFAALRRRTALLGARLALTQTLRGLDALETAKRSVAADPLWPKAYLILGKVFASRSEHIDATAQFRRAIVLGVPNIGHAYCRLALSYEAIGDIDRAVNAYLSALKRQKKYYPAYLGLQRLAFNAYFAGDIDEALRIYTLCNNSGTNNRLLKFYADFDPGPTKDFESRAEEMARILRAAWDKEDAGENKPPQCFWDMKQEQQKSSELLARFVKEKKRVLILHSEYIAHDNQGKNYIKHDLTIAYEESARACGLDHKVFYWDDIYQLRGELNMTFPLGCLRKLEEIIEDYRPHVILMDTNSNLPMLDLAYPLNNDWIIAQRRKYGCSFVGMMSDAYGMIGRSILTYWRKSLDLVVAYEPSPETEKDTAADIMILPVPVPRRYFFAPRRSYRKPQICFIGSTFKYMRATSLVMMEKANLPVFVRGGNRTKDCPSIDEYSATMRQSLATVNFSARDADLPWDENMNCITARVYEAMNSGCVVLEQDNRSVEYFFTPYAHYLPFHSMDELVFVSRFILEKPEIAAELARRGEAFAGQYSDEMFWGRILNRLPLAQA